jgi:hypothetical protein
MVQIPFPVVKIHDSSCTIFSNNRTRTAIAHKYLNFEFIKFANGVHAITFLFIYVSTIFVIRILQITKDSNWQGLDTGLVSQLPSYIPLNLKVQLNSSHTRFDCWKFKFKYNFQQSNLIGGLIVGNSKNVYLTFIQATSHYPGFYYICNFQIYVFLNSPTSIKYF